MQQPHGRSVKLDGTIRLDRQTHVQAVATVRRLHAELDHLDEVVAALRAMRLRQLAAARWRPPEPGGRGSPPPGR